MTYLLDTNVCIDALNLRSSKVKQRLAQHTPDEIVVCSVVEAEQHYGVAKARDSQLAGEATAKFLQPYRSLPFDSAAAAIYGRLRASLDKAGTPVGPNDLLIASIALAGGLTLVTANVSEFSRVAGLAVEDWTKP